MHLASRLPLKDSSISLMNYPILSKKAIIIPKLQSSYLISLGKLCDYNYNVFLNKRSLTVCKNNKKVLPGVINSRDELWEISIKSHTQNNNFKMPSISPGMYQSKTSSPLKIQSKKKFTNYKEHTSKKFHEIPEHTKHLYPLVDIYHNNFMHNASHQLYQHSQLPLRRTILPPGQD